MEKLIRNTDDAAWSVPENRQKLAYHILCELLAYQFASCVSRSLSSPSLPLPALTPTLSRSLVQPRPLD